MLAIQALLKKKNYDKRLAKNLNDNNANVFKEYAKGVSDSAQRIDNSAKLFYASAVLVIQKEYSIAPDNYSTKALEELATGYNFLRDKFEETRLIIMRQMQKDHEASLKIAAHREYQKIGESLVQAGSELISSLSMHISNIMFFDNEVNQLILKIKTHNSLNISTDVVDSISLA